MVTDVTTRAAATDLSLASALYTPPSHLHLSCRSRNSNSSSSSNSFNNNSSISNSSTSQLSTPRPTSRPARWRVRCARAHRRGSCRRSPPSGTWAAAVAKVTRAGASPTRPPWSTPRCLKCPRSRLPSPRLAISFEDKWKKRKLPPVTDYPGHFDHARLVTTVSWRSCEILYSERTQFPWRKVNECVK